MGGKSVEAVGKKKLGIYQQAQQCSRILNFIKTSGRDPFSPLTYSKIMSSAEFAGVFSPKDTLKDVRTYFIRVHKSMQKKERLQFLHLQPLQDYESALEKIKDISPQTAMQNPKLVQALSQYQKDKRNCFFAMRIPDDVLDRKEFIHCKENLRRYREYLYLEHDILVNKSIDLLNAMYALYIFKVKPNNICQPMNETDAEGRNESISSKQNEIFQLGSNKMKFYLLFNGEKRRAEVLHLRSLIEENGGNCVEDSRSADKLIFVGEPNEWMNENHPVPIACHTKPVHTTGLVWQAIGTGLYDPAKDARFRINKKTGQQNNQTSTSNLATMETKTIQSADWEPEPKRARLGIDSSVIGSKQLSPTIEGEDVFFSTKRKVFEGKIFHVDCSQNGEINRRNQILKLIREYGGTISGSIKKETINVLIGPYTVYSAQKSKQEEFNYYDPKIITDTTVIGTFDESNSEVYKYTDDDVADPINTSCTKSVQQDVIIIGQNPDANTGSKMTIISNDGVAQENGSGSNKQPAEVEIQTADDTASKELTLNKEVTNEGTKNTNVYNTFNQPNDKPIQPQICRAGYNNEESQKMVLNQTFVGFENPSQAMMPKVGHPLKPFATDFAVAETLEEINPMNDCTTIAEQCADDIFKKPLEPTVDSTYGCLNVNTEFLMYNSENCDKVSRRFACFLEESLKNPDETTKKTAEHIKSFLHDQFQDEVALKTLQNNIAAMFLKWENEGDRFEQHMLNLGVSQKAINHSRKIKKI